MAKKTPIAVTASSGNVFAEIGVSEPEEELAKAQLASRIPKLPQVMINSAVRHKDQWQIDPEFGAAVSQATNVLRGRGRILVRPSGTEPKLRIMVEGPDAKVVTEVADTLAGIAKERLD